MNEQDIGVWLDSLPDPDPAESHRWTWNGLKHERIQKKPKGFEAKRKAKRKAQKLARKNTK